MLERAFGRVYDKFKFHFYQSIFEKVGNRELSLTTIETFCIEMIYAMDRPTVGEFASFIRISAPNAAYKINSLIKKGYLRKVQSENDKREYRLEVTEKYLDYYNLSTSYMTVVMNRIKEHFGEEELKMLEHILEVTAEELMQEVEYYVKKESE